MSEEKQEAQSENGGRPYLKVYITEDNKIESTSNINDFFLAWQLTQAFLNFLVQRLAKPPEPKSPLILKPHRGLIEAARNGFKRH